METQKASKETTAEEIFKLAIVGYKTAADERDALRQQNMRLVEALRALDHDLDCYDGSITEKWKSVKNARAALASVEGK